MEAGMFLARDFFGDIQKDRSVVMVDLLGKVAWAALKKYSAQDLGVR